MLQTLCVRHTPARLTGEALDAYTLAWCDRLNRSGRAYLTPALLDGRWMVRISIGSLTTERAHVAELWDDMKRVVDDGQ
jgi:aromatic-L-amino-acid decarboxylase